MNFDLTISRTKSTFSTLQFIFCTSERLHRHELSMLPLCLCAALSKSAMQKGFYIKFSKFTLLFQFLSIYGLDFNDFLI